MTNKMQNNPIVVEKEGYFKRVKRNLQCIANRKASSTNKKFRFNREGN